MGLRLDALKAADATVGRIACLLLGLVGRGPSARIAEPADPGSVLLIRPGGIGDAVLLVPLLRFLREAWPSATLDLLVERRNAGVLADSGLTDATLLYDRPLQGLAVALRRRYDVVIDTEQYHRLSAVVAWLTRAPRRIGFGTNGRRRLFTDVAAYSQSLYEVRCFLELGRIATGLLPEWDPERPFYPVPPAAARFAVQELGQLADRRIVAIHPGASIPERRWGAERYARLARLLAEREVGIVIVGGPTDVAAAADIAAVLGRDQYVNLAGRCSLVQAAAVVERVGVYVSADSGVLHLAYGVGTPTVHLFGPGVLSKWGPPGSRFVSVKKPVPCSPCTRYGYTPPCCQGLVCMRGIEVGRVFEEVWAQLERGRGTDDPEGVRP
jgi:lipopolysaccharide heptosyltransferase II